MDLVLAVIGNKKQFQVYRKLEIAYKVKNTVFIVKDFPYTPWPRKGGNLLW